MAHDRPVTTDPRALASIVTGLGGTPLVGTRTFQFDLPLDKCREAITEINNLNLAVRRISSRIEQHPPRLRDAQTIETLELFRRGE